MKQIIKKREDIVFLIKLFPLKSHPDAYRKSLTIQCEGSLELLGDAFDRKEIPDPKCKTDIVDKNIRLAEELGVTGTPSIILGNGRVVSGAMSEEQLLNLIDSAREG